MDDPSHRAYADGRAEFAGAASGCGLECDKLSKEAAETHFAALMGKLIADVGPLVGKSLVATHIDSWENGSQNWTPNSAKSSNAAAVTICCRICRCSRLDRRESRSLRAVSLGLSADDQRIVVARITPGNSAKWRTVTDYG